VNPSAVEARYEIGPKDPRLFLDLTNNRLKILEPCSLSPGELAGIKQYAAELKIGKILCHCRRHEREAFLQSGFVEEGKIPGFFHGETAHCVSFFVDPEREISRRRDLEDMILAQCRANVRNGERLLEEGVLIRDADHGDIPQLTCLFKEIFETYPSPVHRADYLRHIMEHKTMFIVAEIGGEIISVASAEMDAANKNAEITDCATKPDWRGKGLLTYIIARLEKSLEEKDFKVLYSLSRATEPGINKALWKMQYEYSGRMVNNCHICGGFEDMNLWVKTLKQTAKTVGVR
jgi:putative beta-lysine N-acetyltransferase